MKWDLGKFVVFLVTALIIYLVLDLMGFFVH